MNIRFLYHISWHIHHFCYISFPGAIIGFSLYLIIYQKFLDAKLLYERECPISRHDVLFVCLTYNSRISFTQKTYTTKNIYIVFYTIFYNESFYILLCHTFSFLSVCTFVFLIVFLSFCLYNYFFIYYAPMNSLSLLT